MKPGMPKTKYFVILCAAFVIFSTAISAQTIEIEDMPVKTAGYGISGAWVLNSNGYVADSVDFAGSGYYKFTILAKGTNGNDGWPYLELRINNYVCGPIVVNTTGYTEFTTYSHLENGRYFFSLNFTNSSGTRAVTLDRVTITATDVREEDWLVRLAETILVRFPNPGSYSIKNWQIEELMWGVAKAYETTGDVRYLNYVRSHIDGHIDENGNIDIVIDDTIPGILIVWLYQQTHEQKFLTAATHIGEYILTQYPRTSDGGFVHFAYLQDQLWDDTMGGLGRLLGALGAITGDNRYFDEGVLQFQVHAAHLQDAASGLFYHAYDEDGSAAWSDPVTKHSPEFWARGNGWIIRGLADFLQYLPAGYAGRESLVLIFQNLVQGLAQYQETQNDLWFTVLDKGNRSDNYLETSGSLLIAYGIFKGLNIGLLPENYRQVASNANTGLFRRVYEKQDSEIFVTGVSASTSPGNYSYYVGISVGTGEDYPYGDGIFLQEKSEVVKAEASSNYSVSGLVKYYANQNPIPRVAVNLTGHSIASFLTPSDGTYLFEHLVQGGDYQITPVKAPDSDVDANDITTYDAALTAQAAVGLRNLSDDEQIAADVTRDDVIGTYDAALIARYSVGLPKLPDSHVGEWAFSPEFREYQNLVANYTDQDFTGILLGNVHGDWDPVLLAGRKIPDRYFSLPDFEVQSGETFELPIPYLGDENTISVDLVVKFESTKLKFEGVNRSGIGSEPQLFSHVRNGELRLGIFQTHPFDPMNEILRLRFKTTKSEDSETTILIEKYQQNESEIFQSRSQIKIAGDVEGAPKFYQLSQNYPNPFMLGGARFRFTKIGYTIPERAHVRLEVFNSLGQLVKILVDGEKSKGFHSVAWDGKNENGELVSGGIYFYRMKSNSFHSMKKILTLK